jgi:hypothetical protein
MPGKRYTKEDGIKCGIKKCKRLATWQSVNGPRCSVHNAKGEEFPYRDYISRRQYHWNYAGINITYAEYEQKLFDQKNCCMICKRDFDEFKSKPHVDHNHTTGQVRGLLCPRCNMAVEFVESGLVEKVMSYIDFWEGK